MNLLIAVCLVLCWTRVIGQDAAGLIEQTKKEVVIKEMAYILSTIFHNAKFWNYKDISENLFKDTKSNKGLKISEIEVTEVNFDTNSNHYDLEAIEANWIRIAMNSEVFSYLFKFKWEATSGGVHIAFGQGSALFSGTRLAAAYNPVELSATLDISCEISLKNFTGLDPHNHGIKTWIQQKVKTDLVNELKNALNYNRKFLYEYMHYNTKNIRKTLNSEYTLDYNAQVFKVKNHGDYLIYYNNVSLVLNNNTSFKLNLGIEPLPDEFKHDLRFYIAPQYIPLTIQAHGLAKKCDEYFDLKSLNLTGTIKDLFGPLPELYSVYNEEEELKLHCGYGHDGIQYDLPDKKVMLPAVCNFIVGDDTILSAEVTFNMNYEPVVLEGFLAAEMKNITVTKCTSKPETMTSVVFLADLFSHLGQKKFGSGKLQMPMILYLPIMKTSKSESSIKNGIFVTDYDF